MFTKKHVNNVCSNTICNCMKLELSKCPWTLKWINSSMFTKCNTVTPIRKNKSQLQPTIWVKHTSIRLNKWSYAQRSSDSIYIIQVIQNDYGMTPFIWHSKVAHTELKLKGNDLWWKKVKDFVLLVIWLKVTWLCN